jgi:F0F1-type ATP synthase membrane subunit b/b'
MPTKTPVKKTTKKTQKPVKKTVKKNKIKLTWDDIQEGFKELHQTNKEIYQRNIELQKLHEETERTLNKAIAETKKANAETERTLKKANEETERTLKEAIAETKKANAETERTLKKANEETERTLKEANEKTEKTLNKAIGGLSNTLGSIVEHIMTPGLPQKFKQLGYSFNRIASYKWAEGVYAEIDGMLENGNQAVVVEVKTTLRQADIDDHLLRMGKVRKYADEHGDKRQFMGAIAATITDKSTREYALKKGLFVIEPSGEDVKVTKPATEPRIW